MNDAKIDGPHGNGSSTPSVYLRLQKRAHAEASRRGRRPEQAKFRSFSLGFLVLLCASCALWLLVQYVDTDPRFQLHSIDVSGAKYVSRRAVESVFVPDRDVSIYRIPLEQRRQQLEQIPWVRTATISRILPDRMAITVEERQPVAFLWTRHGIELMDQDGVILETPPEVSWTFPVVRGIPEREPAAQRQVRMQRYLRFMEALRLEDGGYPPEISEVDLADPADLSAVVTDSYGALRLHLGEEQFQERYEVYRSHIGDWRQQFSEIHSIDLRYEGQAVIQSAKPFTVSVKPEPGSSAAPGPEASLPPPNQPAPATAPTRSAL